MHKLIYLSVVVYSLVWSGCGKKKDTPQTGQIDLVALNQLLHQYVVQKKEVPKTMDELVARGFVSNLPAPPLGKKLGIVKDAFGYRVILLGQEQSVQSAE